MNFRQFFEIADFVNRDTSGVQFDVMYPHGGRHAPDSSSKPSDFVYKFLVGGKEFSLKLVRYKNSVIHSSFGRRLKELGASEEEIKQYFENVYYLDFVGPSGHKTTGNNPSASGVYGHLLLALRKLSEEYGLDGLVFYPYEESMRLVYSRFIKNFTDFHIVDVAGIYLSKSLLSRIVRKYPGIAGHVKSNVVDNRLALQKTRQNKIQGRRSGELFRSMVGKAIAVVVGNRWRAAIVYSFDRLVVKVYYFDSELSIASTSSVMLSDLGHLSDHPALADEYHALLNILSSIGLKVPGDMRPYVGELA